MNSDFEIDIGNVRGIQGERGEKGDRGKTPTYEEIKYQRQNDHLVAKMGTKPVKPYYIDANNRVCNEEGYLLDENDNVTDVLGTPFGSDYDYDYKLVFIDAIGRYTNEYEELLDEEGNVEYVETSFISDITSYIYNDKKGYDKLVTSIYPHIVDTLTNLDNKDKYKDFFDEIEGNIKYYICTDNPKNSIYIDEEDNLINTCKYLNEEGVVARNNDNSYAFVPLEKYALYLYNRSGYVDNDIMHYDIYVCMKAHTVPKKLVSSTDFIVDYNVIDEVTTESKYNSVTDEDEVTLKIITRGTRGQFYSMDEVDELFDTHVTDKLGVVNGIAQLNSIGKVPSSQLPAYVDDVIEGTMNNDATVFTPNDNDYISNVRQTGTIYVDTNNKNTYRWSGSQYILLRNPVIVDDDTTIAYGSSKGKLIEEKFGLDQDNSDKFNYAIITKGNNIEYWILSNAYYDYDVERFVKINNNYTSFGIQIQASGTYPGEESIDASNVGINFWRNSKTSLYYKDTSVYDYTDVDDNHYIGAERLSDNEWVEFGISTGWSNTFMIDSYGGMTIGGAGLEIDGNGITPFSRLTHSTYTDENNNHFYLLGILDNAYHPTQFGWEMDNNNHYAWFFGLKSPEGGYLTKDTVNTSFVVMYNDTSYDANNVHELDVSKWHIVCEIGKNDFNLTTDNISNTVASNDFNPVSSNAVYNAIDDAVGDIHTLIYGTNGGS